MISISKCGSILNNGNKKFSVDEIKKIRDILHQIAFLDLKNFKKKKNEECNNLHKGINR